jgi:hypothetical protein
MCGKPAGSRDSAHLADVCHGASSKWPFILRHWCSFERDASLGKFRIFNSGIHEISWNEKKLKILVCLKIGYPQISQFQWFPLFPSAIYPLRTTCVPTSHRSHIESPPGFFRKRKPHLALALFLCGCEIWINGQDVERSWRNSICLYLFDLFIFIYFMHRGHCS